MIPLFSLPAQHVTIAEDLKRALGEVLESGRFILGPNVAAFEKEVASYVGCSDAVGVASGTDALHLALRSLKIGRGDDVITTPFSFIATASAISWAGATPVFADVHPDSFNLNPMQIEKRITRRTRAILVVHIYGRPADMSPILDLAKQYGLMVIEDCAQAMGAEYKGRRVGALGDVGCFSFFPTKNLGGLGDGGMVTTNDPEIAQRIRRLRKHGSRERYLAEELGLNSRLDELQAAVLRVQLRYLEGWIEQRRRIAAVYRKRLKGSRVLLPSEDPETKAVYHLYTIRSPQRDRLCDFLGKRGIESRVYYPIPLHLQPVYRPLGYASGSLPIAESLSRQVLSIPLYPDLSGEEAERVAGAIHAFAGGDEETVEIGPVSADETR